MLKFELVLPCFNESRALPALLARAVQAAKAAGESPATFQLVVVENGSSDDSPAVLRSLETGELGAWFRVVEVPVNRGYGFGVWSGLKTTTAGYVGWSHADQQCDPADAFQALALLGTPADKVIAKGYRQGRGWKDAFVTRVFEIMARLLLGFRTREVNAQPKVFPRALLSEVLEPPPNFSFDLYVLYRAAKAGYALRTFPVQFPPRIHGTSKWAYGFVSRYKTIFGMIRYMAKLARSEGRL